MIFQLTSESRGLGGSQAGAGCTPCLARGGIIAGVGIQSALLLTFPLISRRSGPGAHPWHPVTSKPPVKNEPGACKPFGSWLQGSKSLLIPTALRGPWGPPRPAVLHPQSHCSVSRRSLCFPGVTKGRRWSWHVTRWALSANASPCPCSSPQQYPQCPVPGSPSVGAGWIASTSAAAWGTAPGKVPLGLGGCISPCFKPRCQGRGMCPGAQPHQSTGVVWRTSKRLRGQAGSFWGPGNQRKCLLTLSSLLKSCRCLGSQILIKWCDSAGRRVVEAEVSCSTQNRFSIHCTVTVVLFFEVFTGVEV